MELKETLKQASEGTLRCPKCGATEVSLKNVRVSMGADGPKLDPSAYGECGKCNARISLDKLQQMRAGATKSKQWWQFWK